MFINLLFQLFDFFAIFYSNLRLQTQQYKCKKHHADICYYSTVLYFTSLYPVLYSAVDFSTVGRRKDLSYSLQMKE